MSEIGFFAELRRRNVFRVGIAYGIAAWLLAQVADLLLENFGTPDWVMKTLLVVLIIGLPLALIFAWAFELTPEGLKREKEVDRSRSITPQTGRKLDRAIIGVLVVAVALLVFDRFRGHSGAARRPADMPPGVEAEGGRSLKPVAEKSIAVLPFAVMSSGADDEYFADGLTEEILNSLAQLPELLVSARTSAFSFKGHDQPVQEIAERLGVRHIVEGSVRKSGDRLRVTAQLVRASDGFHLWSENYDSTEADTIAVQEDIAEKIATALNVVLDEDFIEFSRILLSAARGDRDHVESLIEAFERQGEAEAFWGLMFHSWAGHRESANALAATVDGRVYGPQSLVLTAYWCACGTPWDLEATPRLKEKLATDGLAWPPASPIHFPLKDW